MKTIAETSPVQISTSITNFSKLDSILIKPMKAGFLGFITILMLLFFINLLSFIVGSNEKFGLDIIDLLLAGVGFVLQTTCTLLKSFSR